MSNFQSSALICHKCTLPGVLCTQKDNNAKLKVPGEEIECSGSCFTHYVNGESMIWLTLFKKVETESDTLLKLTKKKKRYN